MTNREQPGATQTGPLRGTRAATYETLAVAGERTGVRLAVGLGNCVDVTSADVLDHLDGDPELGAVALHVESVADGRGLVAAVERVTDRVPVVAPVVGAATSATSPARTHRGARRVLVELMAPRGPELLVGARRDPVFGPVVVLGLGGTTAEALADVSVRLAPLSRRQAAGMLDDLAERAVVEGLRGGPAVDREALVDAVVAVAGLLAGSPALTEVEVNPLRVLPDGTLAALDAVVRADHAEQHG